MTKDRSCEAGYDSTAQLNPIPQGVISWYGELSFFSDRAIYKLMAEFIDSELTNCVGYLSEMIIIIIIIIEEGEIGVEKHTCREWGETLRIAHASRLPLRYA